MSRLSRFKDKKNRMKNIYASYFTTQPVDKKCVLFESFHGKEISDSPLAMARAFLADPAYSDYKVYFSTTDTARDQVIIDALGLKAELVHIHSDKYAELLATAGFLINNSSFPSYLVRREEQTYLQTWHGTPWKTLGKSMASGIETMHNVQHNFLQADWLLFPNEYTRDAIMNDYNLTGLYTGKVVLSGYPRNSIFSCPEDAARVKALCGDTGISTLAYMPTWRGQDNKNIETDAFTQEINQLLAQLDEALSDDQKLYVNLHPIVQKEVTIDGFRHISTFPQNVDKYEFINSMDALITDYSSVFFDYSITGKPVILFTYDYDEYSSERGLYMDIDELPFKRIDTAEELAECLRDRSYTGFTYDDSGYSERFTRFDSADASKRLVDLIFAGVTSGLEIEDYSFNAEKPRNIIECASIRTTDDLDEVSRMAAERENSLVLFYQADFKPELSEYMHQNYRDAYDYIFTTKSRPVSYMEKLSRNKEIRKRVKDRDLVRRIGGLQAASITRYASPSVKITAIRMRGSICAVDMEYPASLGEVRDIRLVYRSNVEDITHHPAFSTGRSGSKVTLHADADLSLLKDGCVYWDFYIDLEKDGEVTSLPASIPADISRRLSIGFYQADHGEYISFPHISLIRTLAFTHREKSPYDNRMTNFREIAAYAVNKFAGKYLRRRRIWLVFEKFSSAAQDNGYYFFKYCMENLPESERKRIFYVIDRNSRDLKNVEKYGKQIVYYMSFRHLLYTLSARLFVGSDSKKHLYIWRPKPNLISRRMRKKDIHFLQHGVTALKKVDNIFGANGSSPMTSITTTSKYEQQIMIDHFGYSAEQAPVVGFTRWDVLEDKSSPDEKIILVMPTWRAWLEEKTDEDFLASDYFRNYMDMLADEPLTECLRSNNVKLIFFIHPKFKNFLSKFSASSDNIEFVQFGSRPLNEIMMHCSMLVTDYSSVCWDVYYMGKPVVFYQFDYDMYMENHGSYLDMEHELFGERYTELPDLIDSIKRCIESGFAESEKAKEMRRQYFEYIDSDNSKRTYEYLRSRGY